uniref:IBR domain-containing protein n=1 Tax=Haemonchus contortus TaxID=6289 RepID=A0A7I4YS60_HAECO
MVSPNWESDSSSTYWESDSAPYYDSRYTLYFSDDEDPYFRSDHPLWWTKPGCADGKRSKKKRLGSTVVPGAALSSIMKTVEDPANVLSKKGRDRLLSNCTDPFMPGVIYSMEKRNRWKEANPAKLLDSADNDEVSAQVVEMRTPFPENYWKYRAVFGVHELDGNGEMVSKTAGGQGTTLSCMTSPGRQKHRRSRRKQGCNVFEESEKSDAEEVAPGKARIRYTIMHEKPGYYGQYVRRRGSFDTWKSGRSRRICYSDPELSEVEQNEQIEDDGHESKRDKKFHLGDFLTEPRVRRQRGAKSSNLSLSFEKIDLPETDKLKPFDLVDIPSTAKGFFEFGCIDTTDWTDSSFVEQVEALRTNGYEVRWLDRSHQRVLIDATNVVDQPESHTGEPTVVVVIERCFKNNVPGQLLRVHLNSSYLPKEKFDWKIFKKYLTKGKKLGIEDIVDRAARLPQISKRRYGKRLDYSSQIEQSKERLPMFNVKEFIGSTHRISYKHMENMLREQVDTDTFEILSIDGEDDDIRDRTDIPSKCSMERSPSIPSGVKCDDCGNNRISDLYEMEDCWLCRQCVAQLAIRQIRADCVPVNLPFVTPSNITGYDVLPSILPLPLLNFYTKYAATKLIKQSMSNIVLRECPGCKHVVEIVMPNEYNFARCECGIVWCTVCKKEPHWPMTCETAAEWRRRWKYRGLRDDKRSIRLRKISCCCLGPPIVFEELEEYVECENCMIAFNPQSMYRLSYRGYPYRCGKVPVVKDVFLPGFYVPPIKNEVIEICEKARDLRFGVTDMDDLDRACHDIKHTDPNVKSCRNIMLMALYIIEYGTAWVHMEKSLSDREALKSMLTQLIRQHEEVLNAPNFKKSSLSKSLQSLDIVVRKTVDLIKKNL